MEKVKKFLKRIMIIMVLILSIIICNKVQAAGTSGTTIVLNPGHGSLDTGAINYSKNLYERDLNFKIAKFLEAELNKYYNVKVILTHDGVTFPNNDYNDLAGRAMVARNNKADLYVSLHNNNSKDASANGAEIYVTCRKDLPKYNEGMTILANKILQNLSDLGIKNRGVKTRKCDHDGDPRLWYYYYDKDEGDWYGDIRYAMRGDSLNDYGIDFRDGSGIPTVLVEHCFLSSSHDVQFLDSDSDLKKIAQADAKAIVDYLGLKLPSEIDSNIETENVLDLGKDNKISIKNYKVENEYISKIGEKIAISDFMKNITMSDNLEVVIETKEKDQAYIGTNTKVIIKEKSQGSILKEYKCLIYGDLDGDGRITSMDYTLIKNHIMDVGKITDNLVNIVADVDGDTRITSMDYTLIKNHIMDIKKIVAK